MIGNFKLLIKKVWKKKKKYINFHYNKINIINYDC